MYEPYGHHDWNGFPTQPDAHIFRPVPDPEQHIATGHPPFGPDHGNSTWDPAEELACLLQGSMAGGQAEPFDRGIFDEANDTMSTAGLAAGPVGVTRLPEAAAPVGHRRTVTAKAPTAALMRTGSLCTALLVALIAAVVSVLSGLAICDALQHSAAPRTAHDVVSWWPLLIYGPWMVASLSILRAALHQRRAIHSWSIVLLFSTLATLLCVAQAPRTFAAEAAATLPAVAALACFQQLVRQITLTRPPRQPTPRHRNSRPSAAPKFHYGA
ncbi:hypothetical protein [Streptomyces sp. NBC_01443]|uniref:hypothetical protein n=1 Tax=Streptomyces sp. NBC_01443 TaxID=2903868 RepID=UPI00224F42C0|nr:hypothetical protein [Streptomyces sp. NBC_01443]MCX4631753.1 hypothetical protein [Streptomyces sp. NBC_01443]WSW47587.1 hypothetical protein OG296_33275 [Streptomyces sp. NBC_01001]